MKNEIEQHERVIIASILAGNQKARKALVTLSSKAYLFTKAHADYANYLLKCIHESNQNINTTAFCKEFKLSAEDFQELLAYNQNVTPSLSYLLENRYTEEKRAIFEHYKVKSEQERLDRDALDEMTYKLSNTKALREFKTQDEIDEEIISDIEARATGKQKVFTTPFDKWNSMTHGISDEDLIVVGAYSGHGKTHFAIQFALNILEQGGRVCYIAAENSEKQIKIRFGSHLAKLYESHINNVGSDECFALLEGIKQVTEKFGNRLTIISTSSFDDALNLIKSRSSIDLDDIYILDYLQLFSTQEKGMNEERSRLMYYSNSLVDFIATYRKPILALSQLVKGQFNSFKGAQEILNCATVACFMARSEEPEGLTEYGGVPTYRLLLNFKKVRSGSPFKMAANVIGQNPALQVIDAKSISTQEFLKYIDLMPHE